MIAAVLPATAQLRLPAIMSDHMIMQRNEKIRFWGWADKGARVTVALAGNTASAKAARDGRWSVQLPAVPAGGPYTVTVSSKKETITLDDVLVGEVWICSGQSNMEFMLRSINNADEEIRSATNGNIRSFDVQKDMARFPKDDLKGDWKICSPQTAGNFSAVGYLFCREIAERLNVPVGLINTSWGGTDIESWMSMETIDAFPKYRRLMTRLRSEELEAYLARGKEVEAAFLKAIADEPGEKEQWYLPSYSKSDWKPLRVPGLWTDDALSGVDGVVWTTVEFSVPEALAGQPAILSLGMIDDDDVTWINGTKVGSTVGYDIKRRYTVPSGVLKAGKNELTVKIVDNHAGGGCYGSSDLFFLQVGQERLSILGDGWKYKIAVDNEAFEYVEDGPNAFPSRLFNAMVAPIAGYPARGFVWYQGENNAPRAEEYYRLFPAMINDWRSRWNRADMPFYWVQLANYMPSDEHPSASNWAVLRDAQNSARSLPHTGQAVIIDVGDADDIHPRDKQTVGHRLACLALHNDYGMADIYCESPQPLKAVKHGDNVLVTFENVAGGLKAKSRYGYVCGFAVAGKDGKYRWVRAETSGIDAVLLDFTGIDNPKSVRYAWADNPDDANLYNSAGLPAAPFEKAVEE